jgi:hypothetical protein
MPFPPQLFLIGAQKAGTTTFAAALDQYSNITVSTPKETAFFTRNWDKGTAWYEQCFKGPQESLFVDATPAYTLGPTDLFPLPSDRPDHPYAAIPERIRSVAPDARFIYIVREPAARTYSSYWHRVRAREEKRPFRDAIEADTYYLRGSDYYGQILNYLQHFERDAFLFLRFEDVVKDLDDCLRQCFDFLGIRPGEKTAPLDKAQKNRSFQYNLAGRAMAAVFPSDKGFENFVGTVKRLVPEPLKPLLARTITAGIPPLDDADRRFLQDIFRDRNRQLAALTGLSLDHWDAG